MKVRRYTPTDTSTLIRLFYETVHSINAQHYSRRQREAWAPKVVDTNKWQESLSKNICYVVELEGTIVGFADITPLGHIHRLFTHKDFQGRGIGTLLVKYLEEEARKREIENITTHASITAHSFFLHRGFASIENQYITHNGMVFLNYCMRKKL